VPIGEERVLSADSSWRSLAPTAITLVTELQWYKRVSDATYARAGKALWRKGRARHRQNCQLLRVACNGDEYDADVDAAQRQAALAIPRVVPSQPLVTCCVALIL